MARSIPCPTDPRWLPTEGSILVAAHIVGAVGGTDWALGRCWAKALRLRYRLDDSGGGASFPFLKVSLGGSCCHLL